MAKQNENLPAKKHNKEGLSRRDFFKIGAASAAIGAAGATAIPQKVAAKKLDEQVKKKIVNEQDDFPNEISSDYKSIPSYSTVHGHAFFGRQLKAMGVDVDDEAMKQGDSFVHDNNYHYENGKKGWDQKAKAVMAGAWALSATGSGPMPGSIGDFGLLSWDNNTDKPPLALMDLNYVQKEKCQFESKAEAAAVIKRAARLYGADLVGITRRDPRWDYSENFNYVPPLARKIIPQGPEQMQQLMEVGGENIKNAMDSWTPDKWRHDIDEKAGFSPKTVIVSATEMDYEAVSCKLCN
jgi:epoxyqueuosine reductase